MKYRKASHATYDCRYHIVRITKYRRAVLNDEIKVRLENIIRWICKREYVNVISIWMEEDHVHLYISRPISLPIPMLVQKLKWNTSRILRRDYKEYLKGFYWKPHLWARGYFVCTVWEINSEIIKNYVEKQWEEDVVWESVEL